MHNIKRIFAVFIVFIPLTIGGVGNMARESRPQPGRRTTYANAGPYTADEWGELLRDLIVGEDYPDKGVFYSTSNQLQVTNPAGVNIQIDTGRAHVFGRDFRNTSATTITPSTPAANPRIDRVVAVLNNTNAAISTSPAIGTYSFNVAGGGTSIPAYTVEIAILKGTEAGAPVAPALEQDASRLWMIPLAQYQISVVPAISNLTDQRDWVDAMTHRFFVMPSSRPYNTGGGTWIDLIPGGLGGYSFPTTADDCTAEATFSVPNNFISNMSVEVLLRGTGGNITGTNRADYGADGQSWQTHTSTVGPSVVAITNNNNNLILNNSLSSVALDDIVTLFYLASNASAVDQIFVGWEVQYFGYTR